MINDYNKSKFVDHINIIFREGELEKSTSVEIFDRSNPKASRPPMYYNLDVIISVGYRVKSKRGVEFRKWAHSVLKDYILKGYAANETRLRQLGEVVRLMRRTQESLDSKQVLTVIENYSKALDLLDAYDHQTMQRPAGDQAVYILNYEECRSIIDSMRFGNESDLLVLRKMIPLKEALEIYISPSPGWRYTRHYRRRPQTYCILSPRITAFMTETNGSQRQC